MSQHSVGTARWISAGLLLCLSAAFAGAQTTPRLKVIQRFGWEDPSGPAGKTTALQRRLDGGMLAKVVDLAEGRDGSLYVLDQDGAKVVVFDAAGSVRRVIGNGKGQGPGEFTRPNSIALSDNGDLYVLDAAQTRVSVFDPAGKFKRSFLVPGIVGFQMRIVRDRIYVSQYVFKGDARAVWVFDQNGKPLDKLISPSAEDVSFGRAGNTYRLMSMRDGQLAIASPNPGTWTRLAEPGTHFGRALVAENKVNEIGSATATLRGLGELGDRRILMLFDRLKPEALNTPERPLFNIFLAVVKSDGTKDEEFDVGEVGRNLLVSRDGNSFFLTVAQPFYQVVKYRLQAR